MYSYPFKMQLPDWLPSSMALKKNIVLNYLIKAEFTPKNASDTQPEMFPEGSYIFDKNFKKRTISNFRAAKEIKILKPVVLPKLELF
jgi:hypothetical protein